MAVDNIGVVLTTRGARTVRRDLETIGVSAGKAQTAVTLLRRAMGLLGAGLLIKQYATLSDEFINIRNRIKIVTSSMEELIEVHERLLSIANATRSSFRGTTELFVRLSLAAKALGIEQDRLLPVTKSINEAILLSGATAREAEAGLIQLSQGIAANRLGGDELRSVLEQLPVVADVIAKSMGITRGELRLMGEQGKITGEIIVKAFEKARVELADKFAKQVPTIAQQLTVLRNVTVDFIGKLNESTGILTKITGAIKFLSDHVVIFGIVVASAGSIYVGTLLGKLGIAVWVNLTKVIQGTTGALVLLRTVMAGGLATGLANTMAAMGLAGVIAAGLTAAYVGLLTGAAKLGEMLGDWLFATPPLKETWFWANKLKPQIDAVNRVMATGDVDAYRKEMEKLAPAIKLSGKELQKLDKIIDGFRARLVPGFKAIRKYIKEITALERELETGDAPEEFRGFLEILRLELKINLQKPLTEATLALLDLQDEWQNTSKRGKEFRDGLEIIEAQAHALAMALGTLSEADVEGIVARNVAKLTAFLDAKDAKKAAEVAKEAADRVKKLKNEFLSLRDSMLPVAAANREFAESQKLVNKVVARWPQLAGQAQITLGLLAEQLVETADVVKGDVALGFEASQLALKNFDAQLAAGTITFNQWLEKVEKVEELRWELEKFGSTDMTATFDIKVASRQELLDIIESTEKYSFELKRLKKFVEQLDPAWATYNESIRNLDAALALSLITLKKYNLEVEKAFKVVIGKDAALLEKQIDKQIEKQKELTKNQQLGINLASQFGNTLIDASYETDVNWTETFHNMFVDLTKAIAKALLLRAITAGISFGGGGGSIPLPIHPDLLVPEFARGGQFTVGGSGGPDSQLVAFRASPGENITAVPRGKQGQQVPTPAPVINMKTVVVADLEAAMLEVLKSAPGERVQLTTIARHSKKIKRLL